MNRKEAKALVTDWMAGEISARDLKRLKVYLEEHPTFRAEVNKYREAWDDLGDLDQEGYGVPYMGPALERKLQEASSNPDARGGEQNSPETTCQCQTVPAEKADTLTSGGRTLRTLRNPRSSSRIISLAVAASLVLFTSIFVIFAMHDQAPAWTARITGSSSGTTVIRSERQLEVQTGMKLQSGDVLRVPGDGSVRLTYRNEDTSVVATGDAKVRLRTRNDAKYISLQRGSLEVDLAEQADRDKLVVSTSDARAEAVGTRFKIGHDKNTRLRVTEGRVILSSLESADVTRIGQREFAKVTDSGNVISGDVFSGWVEEFEDVAKKARTDRGETAWEATPPEGEDADGFAASDGAFQVSARNNGAGLEDGGVWTSEQIDISGAEKVNVSVEFRERTCGSSGLHQVDAGDIEFELRVALNGEEPRKVVGLSKPPQTPGIGVNGLEGSSLQLQIVAVNRGAPECFSIDRISVLPQ